MKTLVRLIMIFFFLISTVQAAVDILVLPADIFQTKENYYNFEEVSEIVSNDVIKNFSKTNGKIKTQNLSEVKTKFEKNPQLKQTAQSALNQYRAQNTLNYNNFKNIANEFSCNYILIISGSTVTNKNALKRNIWEVLEISTVFNISYPYRLETSAVLLDTTNSLVMWSNNYSTKLGSNDNTFSAKNYARANAELEKIKLYSKTVVSPSIAQNITLRFFPKSIRPIQKEVNENSGGALRFEKNLPEKPKNNLPSTPYFGDMIYGI